MQYFFRLVFVSSQQRKMWVLDGDFHEISVVAEEGCGEERQ